MSSTPGVGPTSERAPLRYLSAADVLAAMPDLDERLALAERTLTALVADAELPPKIGVHPRPDGSFAHAMPAYLRGSDPNGRDDLLGMKWVAGFATNGTLGIPAISAVVVLNDAATGRPSAILDGGPITAMRTAAVSGVAIRRFAPVVTGRVRRATLIGAGVQGRSHLAVLGRVVPGVALTIFDSHRERAEEVAVVARATEGVTSVVVAGEARAAVEGADVVITAAAFGPVRQVMTGEWLSADALVVPVDYATYLAADVARAAPLFLVDDRPQFLANRDAGAFDDYPDPTGTLGEAILAATERPRTGRVVVTHLGVGLADVVFGAAILARAESLGLGVILGV
jgi:ornithine cyclodeaminase/alanine dehydrogenase-like protein (mu-crystallin family)